MKLTKIRQTISIQEHLLELNETDKMFDNWINI